MKARYTPMTTEKYAEMLELLQNGGDYVSEKELAAVLAWAGK